MNIQTTENTKEHKNSYSNLFVNFCAFCCEIKNIGFDGLNGCRNEKVTTNITNDTNISCDLCNSLLKKTSVKSVQSDVKQRHKGIIV